MLHGKINYKWPFSIAMLVYQKVYTFRQPNITSRKKNKKHPFILEIPQRSAMLDDWKIYSCYFNYYSNCTRFPFTHVPYQIPSSHKYATSCHDNLSKAFQNPTVHATIARPSRGTHKLDFSNTQRPRESRNG